MTLAMAEIGFWIALSLWAIGFLACLYGLVVGKRHWLGASVVLALVGLLPLTAGIVVRWSVTGRPRQTR